MLRQDVKWPLIICAYVAFFISGCGAALLRCIPLLASVVVLHAALRRAATEYRCRRGQIPGVPFRCRTHLPISSTMMHCRRLADAAASLAQDDVDVCGRLVFGLQSRGTSGQDPHRVFRELCWAAVQAMSSWANALHISLRSYCYATWVNWNLRRTTFT